MITQCRGYLVDKLKVAGIRSQIHTSMKTLKAYQDSHVGAVIADSDTFSRSHQKKIYQDDSGKHKRWKLFDREATFVVVIGEYTQDKADVIFNEFLANLDAGIYIDGNFTAIEAVEADWVDKEDSILKAQIAVQIKIRFVGGIYKDTHFAHVDEYEVRRVEKEIKDDNQGDNEG